MVYRSPDSASPDPRPALLSEDALVTGLRPNKFWLGISFGCVAGFFEEIGGTGFAFLEMSATRNGFAAALSFGLLWGLWHLPVVDYLGTATPHGA